MNDKAKQLVQLMHKGIIEFFYKKASTGELRKAHGTLNSKFIPPESRRKQGRPKKRPDYLVIYFDTDKQEIRSFKDFLLKRYNKKIDTKQDTNNDEA